MPLNGFQHKVNWSEFKQLRQRPKGSKLVAEINVETSRFIPKIIKSEGDVRVDSISANLNVDTSKSWVVEGEQTASLLAHEQGHYDIVALGTRDLYNRILNLRTNTPEEWEQRSKEINREINKKISEINHNYDKQTDHGESHSSQQMWSTKIEIEKQ